MALQSRNYRKRLEILQAEIEQEQQQVIAQYNIQLERLKTAGMSRENIKVYFGSSHGLMMWDAYKNKIRKLIANFTNYTAEIGYFKGLFKK